MAVRNFGDGRWQVDVYTKSGRRHRAIYTCRDEKQALEIEAATLVNLGKTKIKSKTFSEFKSEYLEFCANQKGIAFKEDVVNLLDKEFGSYRLNQIGTRTLQLYQSKLLKQGLQPATVNRRIATIKHMMSTASDWKIVSDEVLRDVRKVKMLKERNARLRFLTKAEADKLVAECEKGRGSAYIAPIVITALHTGMRLGEILKLRWENVDAVNRIITISASTAKNAERRDIPMNQTLMHLFTKRLARRVDGGAVFHRADKAFTDIRGSFKSALRRSGIKDFHFHDLRHTFASRLVQAGVGVAVVQKLLGHKTYAMTLRYAHLAPDHLSQAVGVLDENKTMEVINE